MSLPERLEQAALALPEDADAIRPANGDPHQLLDALDAAAAARVLCWLLEHAPDEASELAAVWLDEPGGGDVIGAVDEATLPKAGRKALRRLLHAARSRGIEIGTRAAPEAKVARLPDLDQDISAAYVSPLDPRGSRLVYLVESTPAGGARVFETLIDHDRGIVDFQVYRAGRRQVRDFVRDVTHRKGGFAAVTAERDAVRALIARAAERHPESRPLPKPFPEWRTRLTGDVEDKTTPGEQVREALGDSVAEDADLERLTLAIRGRAMGPWPPPADRLETVIGELRERVESDRESAGEQLVGWTREAIEGFYVDELAEVYADRFEESAYVYWQRDDMAMATACLATARALREGRGGEAPALGALVDVVSEALSSDLAQNVGLDPEVGADEESSE